MINRTYTPFTAFSPFSPPCQGKIDSWDNKPASLTDCLQLDSDKTDQLQLKL